jgi:hypothetical protein
LQTRPNIHQGVFDLTAHDSASIAEALARKYLGNRPAVDSLLDRSGKDLVVTKWLLEAIVIDKQSPNSTPLQAARMKLDDLRRNGGDELLRLYLTLAAFG